MQKRALSLLIRPNLYLFSHRMDIRCFLTGIIGQEEPPSGIIGKTEPPSGIIGQERAAG